MTIYLDEQSADIVDIFRFTHEEPVITKAPVIPPTKRPTRNRCTVKWYSSPHVLDEERCSAAGYWGYPGNHHCKLVHKNMNDPEIIHVCACGEAVE